MKRYKLLKDLPFAKAGEIFERHTFKSEDGLSDYDYFEICKLKHGEVNKTAFGIKRNDFIDNFDDWFEEITEKKWHDYYYLDEFGHIHKQRYTTDDDFDHRIHDWKKSIGNCFATRREAKQYRKWLKARAVLIQDAKGFKPDWDNWGEQKWCVEYNYIINCLCVRYTERYDFGAIYFKCQEDVNESIKTHEKEWKTYLGVE